MTFKLGLTGSIGMGKSTTAELFRKEGCSVWDADASVHRLYRKGGKAVSSVKNVFPSVIEDGAVSRVKLKTLLAKTPAALRKIEQIVHPLVGQDRSNFISNADTDIVVFDIPLLFETGADATMDATVCVTTDEDTQRKRVMERGTMTEDVFQTVLSKQMPDAEKRAKATYVIVTDTVEHAHEQVREILRDIRGKADA